MSADSLNGIQAPLEINAYRAVERFSSCDSAEFFIKQMLEVILPFGHLSFSLNTIKKYKGTFEDQFGKNHSSQKSAP